MTKRASFVGMPAAAAGPSTLSVDDLDRDGGMNEIKRFQKAIRDLHGLNSGHIDCVHVREIFQGDAVWEGDVQVFVVFGHPQATRAYGWSCIGDAGEPRYLAVLGVPPINSAIDAVRTAVMAHIEERVAMASSLVPGPRPTCPGGTPVPPLATHAEAGQQGGRGKEESRS